MVVRVTDLTLEDLAGTATETATKEVAKEAVEAESGESFKELLEFLDDRIGLDKLMFGINDDTAGGMATDAEVTATDSGEVVLSADSIAALAEELDEAGYGDVTISRVGQFAQAQPERINQVIAGLGDDGGD